MVISPRMRSSRDARRLAGVALLVVIAALISGLAVFFLMRDSTPGNDSVEAGFLRDMQVHHHQAVDMADIIRFRTHDDQIYAMATDIAFSQTSQIGMMQGVLDVWGLSPTGDEPAMAWMGHPTTGLMPGMATEEEVNLLSTLPVDQAEVLFMQLMNRHHVAGVEMAQAVLDRSDQPDIVDMAEAMIRVQSAEIQIMNQLLEERGAEPITTSNAEIPIPSSATPSASPASTPTSEGHDHG